MIRYCRNENLKWNKIKPRFFLLGKLEFAEKTYVDVDIFSDAFKDRLNSLEQLPTNCYESAENLKRQADIYTQYGVFSQKMIDGMIEQLKSFKDQKLFKEVSGDPDKMMELVNKYFYCG